MATITERKGARGITFNVTIRKKGYRASGVPCTQLHESSHTGAQQLLLK